MNLLYFNNITYKILIISILFFTLSCSKKDPVTGKKVRIEPNAITKAEAAREKSGSLLFGKKSDQGEEKTLGNSNVLWQATLNTLENIPLAQTDFSGGLIITDWYGSEIKDGVSNQIKITVQFISNEISPNSFKVLAHKKSCQNFSCKTSKVKSGVSSKIKENIMEEVRKLKISKEAN